MEKNAKLAPLQASLRQVAIFLHNADFYRLRRSKMPANASGTTIRLLHWFWLRYNTRWSVNYKKDFVYIKMN